MKNEMGKFQRLVLLALVTMQWISTTRGWCLWNCGRRRCNSSPCRWQWNPCDRSCGGGTRVARLTAAKGSCGSCNMPSGRHPCNTQCCPVDCRLSSWGPWDPCSSSCGANGKQYRSRHILQKAECNGARCRQDLIQTRSCSRVCFNDGFLDIHNGVCKCASGWTGACCNQDVNECVQTNHPCSAKHMTCENTNGGFVCGCNKGYEMRGSTCKKV